MTAFFGEFPEEDRFPVPRQVAIVRDGPACVTLDDLPDPEQTLAATPARVETDLSSLTASDKLESLTDTALKRLADILKWPVPSTPAQKGDFEQVKLQLSAINTVMTAQLKVDDNRLKKQSADMLPTLLRELRDEERRLITVNAIAHQI